MPIGEQEDIDQQAAVVQATRDHPDTVHPFVVGVVLVKMEELVFSPTHVVV